MAIEIKKNQNGDTRTAPSDVTFEQFSEANNMHREDVRKVMAYLADMVYRAGKMHDYTKKSRDALFYDNFLTTKETGTSFTESEWYQMHVTTERHHLINGCPEDVNLVDVMEMIADCVCAGLARNGTVYDVEIDEEILTKAVKNTTELIKKEIECK